MWSAFLAHCFFRLFSFFQAPDKSSFFWSFTPFLGGGWFFTFRWHMKLSCESTLHSHPPCSGGLLFLLNHWIKSWCSHVKGTSPWKIQDVSCFLPHPLWFQVRGDGHSLPFTDASFDTVVGRVWLKLVDSVQSGVIFDGRLPILALVWEKSLNMTTWGLPKPCNTWKIYSLVGREPY